MDKYQIAFAYAITAFVLVALSFFAVMCVRY